MLADHLLLNSTLFGDAFQTKEETLFDESSSGSDISSYDSGLQFQLNEILQDVCDISASDCSSGDSEGLNLLLSNEKFVLDENLNVSLFEDDAASISVQFLGNVNCGQLQKDENDEGICFSFTNNIPSEIHAADWENTASTWELQDEDCRAVSDELSDVIFTKLGLREQLEVLRIIDPHGQQNHTTKLLSIDFDELSEETLDRVREYVESLNHQTEGSHSKSSSQHKSNSSQDHKSKSSTPHHTTKRHCDNSSANLTRSPSKRQAKKKRRERQRPERQRQRKEARQIVKEKRSGLFRSEQVLSLSRQSESRDDAEEDVDIIT